MNDLIVSFVTGWNNSLNSPEKRMVHINPKLYIVYEDVKITDSSRVYTKYMRRKVIRIA